ncbi:MAG TPA: rhodanese-like domain-containing protein [Anaerolineae bacterium]|nr:rhodanese-like domain-containing protein [Anaerolineae bacterium]
MIKKIHLSLVMLIVLSLVLGACTTPAAPPTAAPPTQVPAAPTQAPEPTAVPEAPLDVEGLFAGLIDGLPADKSFGTISAAKLNEALADKPPFLLDVREVSEIESDGYIEGAVHIAIRDLLKNLDQLPGQGEPIVVYCGSGHRGGLALAALKLLGYSDVRNLGGGLGAWKKASLPVVTGSMPEAGKTLGSPAIEDQALFTTLDEFLSGMPDGFYTIKADKLGEALAASTPPVLIDVRTLDEWNKDGYIEGALHLPFNEFFANLNPLPKPDQPIVVYCGSGHRGAIVMMALRLMGYSDVTNLGGGLGAWKAASLPVAGWVNWPVVWTEYTAALPGQGFYAIKPDGLNSLLADNPPYLLDVREAAEVENDGYIAGAVHIPIRDVLTNLDKLPALDQPIVVYCGSGHRGGMALAALQLLGYSDVRNLNGGLGAWKKASLPVETGLPEAGASGAAPEVDAIRLRDLDAFLAGLPAGFLTVKAPDLNTELAGTTPPILVDVRTSEETAQGYIEGSLLIPIDQLLTNLNQLPDKSAPIVVTCQSGHRGAIGMMALQMLGYTDVRNLGGGVNAWDAAELPLTAN